MAYPQLTLQHHSLVKPTLAIISLLIISAIAPAAEIALIPQPTTLTTGQGTFTFTRPPSISASPALAREARTLAALLATATGWQPAISQKADAKADIILIIDESLTATGDEGYHLQVTPTGIRIQARKPAGIFYGIQTLRQLLPVEIDNPTQVKDITWSIPCVDIHDAPRFAWRGFMLDSCRHFQSVATVKQVIDQLARHKLNRLHWHLTEDEAWRIEVEGHPELTGKGAWRSGREEGKDVARYGGYYSAKDVRDVIAYARERHVLVYPELEMPGHSTAAIYACPQFGCDGKPVIPGAPGELGITSFSASGRRAFCPSRPETYRFLEDVALKTSKLFDTPYLHIGADEVPREQWDKCSRCQDFIAKHALKDDVGLQQHFGAQMTAFLRKNGRQPIYWGVDLERGIPEGIIVQGWHPGESALAAKKGFTTINSDCTGTYFDFPAGPGDTGDGSPYLGRLPIEKVYQFDPVPAGLTPDQEKLVIGSEAPLWTEYVPENKVMSKVYPRLFAFAEVVWSPRQPRDFIAFRQRMTTHIERLELQELSYYGHSSTGTGRLVGTWSPQSLQPGEATLEFDITRAVQPLPRARTYQATFQFQKGQHALQIRSVALCRDGVELSREAHPGIAGGRHEGNRYDLTIPDAKPGRFTLRAQVAGMDGTDSQGEIRLAPAP